MIEKTSCKSISYPAVKQNVSQSQTLDKTCSPGLYTGIWKCWFLRRGENRSTRRKTSRSKGENQQQTQPTYGVDAWIRTRATLVGGEREIRLLKERDGGVENTCSFSPIHFVWLSLLVDELPNERVERNSQIFFKLIILATIRLRYGRPQADSYPVVSQSKREKRETDAVFETLSSRFFSLQLQVCSSTLPGFQI